MSDYETAQRRRNIIVGIFAIVGLCAFSWLIFKFGDLPTAVSKVGSFEVFVQFPTAPGVQKDTPARFCGYQIGSVTDVKPPKVLKDLNTGRFYHQTLVVLSIDKRYNDIPADVEAKLMTRGLGSSYIELKLRHFDANEPAGPFLVEDSLLQGSTGMTSEFFPEESQKKLDELIEGLRTFISNANDVLGDPKNKENIKKTLANLSEASQQATQTMEQVTQTLQKAEHTIKEFREFAAAGTTTFKSTDAKAERLVVAMVNSSEELSKAASQLRVILEKVNNSQGTFGKLINDARLYENLLESNEQLQALIQQIRSVIDKVNEEGLRSIY